MTLCSEVLVCEEKQRWICEAQGKPTDSSKNRKWKLSRLGSYSWEISPELLLEPPYSRINRLRNKTSDSVALSATLGSKDAAHYREKSERQRLVHQGEMWNN